MQTCNGTADIHARLARDARDIAAFIEARGRLADVRINVVVPYGWPGHRVVLCGVAVWSDGRAGLSTFSRGVLLRLGWEFQGSLDAADYHGFDCSGVSAHRRLAACRRIAEAASSAGIRFPAGR